VPQQLQAIVGQQAAPGRWAAHQLEVALAVGLVVRGIALGLPSYF